MLFRSFAAVVLRRLPLWEVVPENFYNHFPVFVNLGLAVLLVHRLDNQAGQVTSEARRVH